MQAKQKIADLIKKSIGENKTAADWSARNSAAFLFESEKNRLRGVSQLVLLPFMRQCSM